MSTPERFPRSRQKKTDLDIPADAVYEVTDELKSKGLRTGDVVTLHYESSMGTHMYATGRTVGRILSLTSRSITLMNDRDRAHGPGIVVTMGPLGGGQMTDPSGTDPWNWSRFALDISNDRFDYDAGRYVSGPPRHWGYAARMGW